MEGLEPVTDHGDEEPPPSIAAKCMSLHHIMTTFGRLQIAQACCTFLTLIISLLSLLSITLPIFQTQTQLVGLISVFGFSLIFDLLGFFFLHFAIDDAFEFFIDRPYITRIGKVIYPASIGLCQMFAVLVATPLGNVYMNITMLFGFASALLHLVQVGWIQKIFTKRVRENRRAEIGRCTYTRSTDPLPDIFDSASMEDDYNPPTFTARLTSIKKKTDDSSHSRSPKSSISSKNSSTPSNSPTSSRRSERIRDRQSEGSDRAAVVVSFSDEVHAYFVEPGSSDLNKK